MNNVCPACGAVYSVTAQHVGRRIACKKCGTPLVVEADGIQLANGGPKAAPSPEPADEEAAFAFTASTSIAPEVVVKAPAREVHKPARASSLLDYLAFRRMLTPYLIQFIFWVGTVLCIVWGGLWLLFAVLEHPMGSGAMVAGVLWGLGQIILGPILIRVSCELVMVVFRIHEGINELKGTAGNAEEASDQT